MKRAIEWMVENHVAANLLMILIVLAGIVSLFSLKMEVFPEITMDSISIQMVYRGASPDEIENSIVMKIEDAVAGLDGVQKVKSISNEGVGQVTVEVQYGEDVSEVRDRVKSEIDRITTFPAGAEKPVIKEMVRKSPVIKLGVYGDINERSLTEICEHIRDDLLQFPHISQVGLSGLRNYEISIEISENRLREYNLTFDQISIAIKKGSLDLPGGKIKNEHGEILIRTKGLGYTKEDYENIIIRSDIAGNTLKIKDVATVKDGFEDADMSTAFNGKPAALVTVYRVGDQGALKVAGTVKKYIKQKQKSLPEGMEIISWDDKSIILKQRLSLLLKNTWMGLILVLICLALFLDIRLAIWVASGIVISFFGSFIAMGVFNVSINMISLFAFIVVLGIVVDDAIVVGENIFSNREKGLPPLKSAKNGVLRVTVPVIFAVLTTVAAFGPLVFAEGNMGKIMKVIPTIVISVLLFSLIESLFILPAHLSRIKLETTNVVFAFVNKANKWVDSWLNKFINNRFVPFLRKALAYRYLVIGTGVALFFITIGLIAGGFVKFTFMPEVEGDNMWASLSMHSGTSIEETRRIVLQIEEAAEKTRIDFRKKHSNIKGKLYQNRFSIVGDQPANKMGPHGRGDGLIDPTIAEVNIELQSSEERKFSAFDLMNMWRANCQHLVGLKSLTFSSSIMSSGNAVELQLSSSNHENLTFAVEDVKELLAQYNGVFDIRDDFEEGKMELKLNLKLLASTMGITLSDLARQVRQGFYGDEALRIQRGRDEVKIMVRYSESQRRSLADIENMLIRNNKGVQVPFTDIAVVSYGRGYSKIKRSDHKRIISVIADVDDQVANANEIFSELKHKIETEIKTKYPGLSYSSEGAQKEQKRTMVSLARGFIIAIFLIYLLLAIPFKSYVQPLVIMSAIPFGFIGAVVGHIIMQYDLSMLSGMGVIALSGVVVNDSLVLVDFINGLRRNHGMPLIDAIVESAKNRFRPILLTSLTTFLGLMPMLFETSFQAKILIPMAISLGFGIVFATTITLIFIPAQVMILEDILGFFKKDNNVEIATAGGRNE